MLAFSLPKVWGVLFKLFLYYTSFVTDNMHAQIIPENPMLPQDFEAMKNTTQAPLDHFEKHLCRERKHRMDWREILKPCEGNMKFSSSIYSHNRTRASYSIILNQDIRNTGEYSSFRIKTFDYNNLPKTIGGDTWRVFIKGPASLEPPVYDLKNGEYEVSFLILEAGEYLANIVLEGSLCSSFVDPPPDWFKNGDFNGHFQSSWQYKHNKGWPFLIEERMWQSLTNFTFTVPKGDHLKTKVNLQKIRNWPRICNSHLKCLFLNDGFGRWVNDTWKDHVINHVWPAQQKNSIPRYKKGTLWIYGDCYAYHFFQSIWNKTLCTEEFKTCKKTYNWIYPRWHVDPKKDKSIHWKRHFDIDLPWLIRYFKRVLDRPEMNRTGSGMLLNLGLHFLRSTSFENYQVLIDEFIKVIKQHKTEVVWRTTTAIYRPERKAHKRFQTYQRSMLFNAYSISAMCNAAIPVIDVFPMTSSIPRKPKDGIHYDISLFKPVKEIMQKYYHYM